MSEAEVVHNQGDEVDAPGEKRVGSLELFFDLVFVFALTQVTRLMADSPTWEGLTQGLFVLAALWWAWAAFSWLTNYIDTERDVDRLLLFGVMGAMLVAGLATPGAFGDNALLFGIAYALVRWLHIFVWAEANKAVDTATAIRRLARTAIPAPALLILASAFDGDAQMAVWVLALAIDFLGPYVFGVRGFKVSAGHFAERFGLILIIALGESIVAISAADSGSLAGGIVTAAVLGLVVSAAMWWAYFDVASVMAAERFRATTGHDRSRMARDAYSYMHLPMVAGIVGLALGLKKTVLHVDDPLKVEVAAALFVGIALYLLAHVAFKWRVLGSISTPRLIAAGLSLASIPIATEVDALFALALAAAITAGLIAFEALHYATARQEVRTNHQP